MCRVKSHVEEFPNKGPWAGQCKMTTTLGSYVSSLMLAYHPNTPVPTGHSQLQGMTIGNTMTKKALGRLDEDLHSPWIGCYSQSDY
jgi:hypothetical protein